MPLPIPSSHHPQRIVGGLIVGVVPEERHARASFSDRRAHLFISGPDSLGRTSTGPIQIRVTVPKGYTHELVATDDGFGHGYDVRVDHQDRPADDVQPPDLRVEVLVPAAETVPIELEVIAESTLDAVPRCRGRSNRPAAVGTGYLA